MRYDVRRLQESRTVAHSYPRLLLTFVNTSMIPLLLTFVNTMGEPRSERFQLLMERRRETAKRLGADRKKETWSAVQAGNIVQAEPQRSA